MLENIAQREVAARNQRTWLPVMSLALASVSSVMLGLPSFSADTVVQRKILMTNDGLTETTTTTTTERSYPAVVNVDRVVVPADRVIVPTVERVVVPAPIVADSVVVPAVPVTTTTTVEKVVVPATPVAVQRVTIDGAVYKSALETRSKAIRAVIATNISNGMLTAEQAARYRAELDRLSALELAMDKGGAWTYEKVLPLAYEYDLLGTNLKVVNYTPFVQSGKVVFSDAHVVQIDDLMNRRAGLEAKISMQYADGKLSASEADRLRGMLNHVAVLEGGFRADGEISDKEAKTLYGEFDKVGSEIDKAL
jgi:hypothetical protein